MSTFSNLKINGDELIFDVKNLDRSILNCLRRIMISEVSTLAFLTNYGKESDIEIEENSSSLHNEFLSHRLSLIPLHYPHNMIDEYEKNKYEFIIDITNTKSKIIDVTTEHIQIKDVKNDKLLTKNECNKFFPPNHITNDYILINKLKPSKSGVKDNGESLKIKMFADKNIGKIHARYTPTCVSIFTNKRDENKIKLKLDELLNQKINEYKNKNKALSENEKLRIVNTFMISEADKYFHTDEYGEPNYFEFTIESDGRIPPHIIFSKSFDVIDKKLDNFLGKLDNTDYITFSKSDCIMQSYDINITDEDYTIGYLLEHYLYKEYFISENKKINYISQTIPHPLINKLLIRISLVDNSMKEDYIKELLKEVIKIIKKDFNNIYKEFISNKELSFN